MHKNDIDGRVRFVTFILGMKPRDAFLHDMRVQLKVQNSVAKSSHKFKGL
jgi:hypothetical protein